MKMESYFKGKFYYFRCGFKFLTLEKILKLEPTMKTNRKEKNFDAVKMMREIRDKISQETQEIRQNKFNKIKEF